MKISRNFIFKYCFLFQNIYVLIVEHITCTLLDILIVSIIVVSHMSLLYLLSTDKYSFTNEDLLWLTQFSCLLAYPHNSHLWGGGQVESVLLI